jgi:hypothetical protein
MQHHKDVSGGSASLDGITEAPCPEEKILKNQDHLIGDLL